MQDGAGKRKALALTAGEVGRALGEACVQPLLAPQVVGQVGHLERRPELFLGDARRGHEEVVAHRARKEPGAQAHVGHVPGERRRVKVAHLRLAQQGLAGIAGQAAAQERGDGGLAAAGLAHDGGHAADRHLKAHAMQDLALGHIAKRHVAQAERVARLRREGAGRRLRQLEQAEDLLACGHAVHGHVEVGAQLAHGQEEVRGDEDDEETPKEVDGARGRGKERHRDARHGASQGHDVHHNDGVELHGEHLHGDGAEALRLLVHGLVARGVRLVDLEGGEALEVLEEAVAQLGVLVPVLAQDALCHLLHRHDGHGDERHAEQQHDRRGQAHGRHHRKQRHRRQHGIEELREVLAKVGLKLLAALHGELHHLGRGHLVRVAGAHGQELLVDAAAQHALDVLGGGKALAGGKARGHHAQDDAHGQQGPRHPRHRHARDQRGRHPCNDPDQCHVAHQAHPLPGHRGQHVPQGLGHQRQKPFVHHVGYTPILHAARSASRLNDNVG